VENKFRYPVSFWISSSERDQLLHALLMTLRSFCSVLSWSQNTMLPVSSTNPTKLMAVPSSFLDVFILNPTRVQSLVMISLDFLR